MCDLDVCVLETTPIMEPFLCFLFSFSTFASLRPESVSIKLQLDRKRWKLNMYIVKTKYY